MNTTVARAYVLSRMDDWEIKNLHNEEDDLGYCMSPGVIHLKFQTKPWGEVNQEDQYQLAGKIMDIYFKNLNSYKEKDPMNWPMMDVPMNHDVDNSVRSLNLSFERSKSDNEVQNKIEAVKKKSKNYKFAYQS